MFEQVLVNFSLNKIELKNMKQLYLLLSFIMKKFLNEIKINTKQGFC